MTISAGLLTRQRTLAAKIETTTGTPIALAAGDGAVNVFDSSLKAAIPAQERERQGTLSGLDPVPGESAARCSFKTEMTASGSATDPFWLAVLAVISGFSPTSGGVYFPVTGASATATMGLYLAGQQLSMSGAAGKFSIEFAAGKVPMISADCNGVWQPPSSVALLAPTYPTIAPLRFAGATLTVGGSSYKINKLTLAIENTVAAREDATAVDSAGYGTGILAYQITGRKITTKFSAEALPLGTKDWWADHRSVTAAALSMTLGSGTHGQIVIAAPRLIHLEAPQEENVQGIYHNALSFLNAASGVDNELSFQQQ